MSTDCKRLKKVITFCKSFVERINKILISVLAQNTSMDNPLVTTKSVCSRGDLRNNSCWKVTEKQRTKFHFRMSTISRPSGPFVALLSSQCLSKMCSISHAADKVWSNMKKAHPLQPHLLALQVVIAVAERHLLYFSHPTPVFSWHNFSTQTKNSFKKPI